MAALMWISHSERRLNANELCHALAVKIGSPNIDTGSVPSIGTLLTCCQGLVAVDKDASTVRLIHFTVQEYLRARPELFGPAHSTIAETCLSYLNSQQVMALADGIHPEGSRFQTAPFLEYSSLYWGVHAKRELSDCAKLLALKLFDDCDDHISTDILLGAQDDIYADGLSPFTGLHCASFFGIVELVACLLEVETCDINQEDPTGNTPLVWAAQNGHEGVVEILLGRDDIDPDKPGAWEQTPLSYASWNGHEGVVKILLRRKDIDPNKIDWDGETPLSYASKSEHGGVVKVLLERDDVDPNRLNPEGRTPLFEAAFNGDEEVVAALLRRGDLSRDKQDTRGLTPLNGAAGGGV